MKTIFITVPDGFHVRYLLRSEAFEELTKHCRIVIFSPNYNEGYFIRDFSHPNVHLEPLHSPKISRSHRFVTSLRNEVFCNRTLTKTMNLKYEKRRKEQPITHHIMDVMNKYLGSSPWLRRLWFNLESTFVNHSLYDEAFQKYAPDLVIVATPGQKPPDIPMLLAAKKRKIITLSIIFSWDNLTSKGAMFSKPDLLVVWNDIMRQEAIDYHGYNKENVRLAGVTQFDIYYDRRKLLSRQRFFEDNHLDTDKSLVTLTTGPTAIYRYHKDIIDIIMQAARENRFIKSIQLLVRPHPRDDFTQYESYKNQSDIVIDHPGRFSNHLGWDPTQKDAMHLAETMLHSDVIVNVASTISIDAACFDTPVVNIAFDGLSELSYHQSCRRYYDYTHYLNVVKTGGVTLVENPEKLIAAINGYLANPSLHADGRKRIVEEQCYKLDGQSGKRVSKIVLDLLGGELNQCLGQ